MSPYNETDGGAEYDNILNEFYNEIEILSNERPYMVAPGQIIFSHIPVVGYTANTYTRKPRGQLR